MLLRVPSLLLAALALGCSSKAPETPAKADRSPPSAGSKAEAPSDAAPEASPLQLAERTLSAELIRTHTKALSDDAMEGRQPGTPGGARAVQYIVTAMKDLGLQPGAGQDFTQPVAMRSVITQSESASFAWVGRGPKAPLTVGTDLVAGSFGPAGPHEIDAELVFAGYGITAPEHRWDDYAGLDVKDKIVVVFVGDPPVTDGRFGGDAMTYYGRWNYKFERALEAGAAGCLVIHETEPASYGWNVVRNSWTGERFHVVEPDGELPSALLVQGWLSQDAAEQLAKRVGTSLQAWHERALAESPPGKALGVRLQGTFTSTDRQLRDVNVLGKIEGASRPDEAVFITAHWDHLGMEAGEAEDRIFNGAVDNASGIAGMLAIAAGIDAHVKAGRRPARSIVFLATTAEEQGLLGSKYFADHPTMAIEKILAVVNLDSMNVLGRTTTIQVIGPGHTTLEDMLAEVAAAQNRRIVPDEHPRSGGYYRSDHFSFARRGVPAIYFRGGLEMEVGGKEAGQALAAKKAEHYHTVHDEFDPAWSFEGAEQDAEAVMRLVLEVADRDTPPTWKPTSEFAALRAPPR